MLGLMALLSFNSKITAIEKEAYESPTEVQILLSPNGLPSSVQIAGIIMSRRFPKFPVLTSTKSRQQSGVSIIYAHECDKLISANTSNLMNM